jgi:hypothetical protein
MQGFKFPRDRSNSRGSSAGRHVPTLKETTFAGTGGSRPLAKSAQARARSPSRVRCRPTLVVLVRSQTKPTGPSDSIWTPRLRISS